MSRQEFTAKSKLLAFERANGRCERCDVKLRPGRWHADHMIPCGLGGDNSWLNCQILCAPCHATKTGTKDIPVIAKCKRIRRRALGIKKPRTIRAWRRFDGSIVRAND